MPSLDWNRFWQRDFREFRQKKPGQTYGVQWDDPEVRGIRYFIQRNTSGPTSNLLPQCLRSDPAVDAGRAGFSAHGHLRRHQSGFS
jgi:hypothetical protein